MHGFFYDLQDTLSPTILYCITADGWVFFSVVLIFKIMPRSKRNGDHIHNSYHQSTNFTELHCTPPEKDANFTELHCTPPEKDANPCRKGGALLRQNA